MDNQFISQQDPIVCRSMNREEIPSVMRLCRAAAWNQLEIDWEQFFEHNPASCSVATANDQIVGTVATIAYADRFSWIGMMLVDPAYRRHGIGTKLMHEAMATLRDQRSIRLDATPMGREVYLKLDFVDEYPLSRMEIVVPEAILPEKNNVARPMRAADLKKIIELDTDIFGAERPRLLEWLFHQMPQYAWVVEEGTQIAGYSLGRTGYHFDHPGPVIAQEEEIARHLVAACLTGQTGKPIALDVNHHAPTWIAWLESIGFKEQRSLFRMGRGENRYPGIAEKQFAILGPEFG